MIFEMRLKFLQAQAVSKTLQRLIDEYEEFHWATAWGSLTNVAERLLAHPAKFSDVTFGVAFSQTDPALIDRLVGLVGARVATKFAGGTYHPKVYAFRSGEKAAAVVGSANFTFGGLGRNMEAAILAQGEAADPFFVDLFDFTRQSAAVGEAVTPQFAAAYRASHKRAARMPKAARDPIQDLPNVKVEALSSPLVTMGWDDYVQEVRGSKNHPIDDSLALLRIAQQWFGSVRSFQDLSLGQRQAIAGLIIDRTERADDDLGRDWGWFGSMRGMGDFAKLVIANDKRLARAIDSIPQKGEITRTHFSRFARLFKLAFEDSERIGGYATGSRLLAMKRPDVFVCICTPNIAEASARMDFSRTTLTLEGYWDKVVEVIRFADWYNADKPDSADSEIWECRAAMLDAVLYRP